MTNLFEILKVVSALIYPFMPDTSLKIQQQMGIEGISNDDALRWSTDLNYGNILKGEPLFIKK